MDESGVEENLSSEYGYAKKGKRLYAKKKDSRYSRRSLISAIGKNEIKASLEIKGSVNAEVIKKYFKEILLPKLEPESIIVLDNAIFSFFFFNSRIFLFMASIESIVSQNDLFFKR
mgnify:CR=1 FL=1